MIIEQMPRSQWSPVPRQGTMGVTGRVLLNRAGIAVANLRFSPHATIDEHSAPIEVDVISHGRRRVRFGRQRIPRPSAQATVSIWPAGVNHRLWTEGSEMETLMIERHGS